MFSQSIQFLLCLACTAGSKSSVSLLACNQNTVKAARSSGLLNFQLLNCNDSDPAFSALLDWSLTGGSLLVLTLNPERCSLYRTMVHSITERSRFSSPVLLSGCPGEESDNEYLLEAQPLISVWTRAVVSVISRIRKEHSFQFYLWVLENEHVKENLALTILENSSVREFWIAANEKALSERIETWHSQETVVLLLVAPLRPVPAAPPGTLPLLVRPLSPVGLPSESSEGSWIILDAIDTPTSLPTFDSSFSRGENMNTTQSILSDTFVSAFDASSMFRSWLESNVELDGGAVFATANGGQGQMDVRGRRNVTFFLHDGNRRVLARITSDGKIIYWLPFWTVAWISDTGGRDALRVSFWICFVVAICLISAFIFGFARRRLSQQRSIFLPTRDLILHTPRNPNSSTSLTIPVSNQSESPSTSAPRNNTTRDRKTGQYKWMEVILASLPEKFEMNKSKLVYIEKVRKLRHENLSTLLGCWNGNNILHIVWTSCSRGSLDSILYGERRCRHLDWELRTQILRDIASGLSYLHGSWLNGHGSLTSKVCLVDNRWLVKITDYGMRTLEGPRTEAFSNDLLWCAPEVLRDHRLSFIFRPSPEADMFSFAIVIQEIVLRSPPYSGLTPQEVVEGHGPFPTTGLFRPSVPPLCGPPGILLIMKRCWLEEPVNRPKANALLDEIDRQLKCLRETSWSSCGQSSASSTCSGTRVLAQKQRITELEDENQLTAKLLDSMLPEYVSRNLKAGVPVIPEKFQEVTIYFSDIVGFTTISSYLEPIEIVSFLNDLYTVFDAVIDNYEVYKVETIGDAYMVASGVPEHRSDHAEQIATMALHILHSSSSFKIRSLPGVSFQIRTGIHTGPVVAGVVGTTMPRYCLFGDSVNIASRMESTSKGNAIQVSSTTEVLLRSAGGYHLQIRGLTELKGRGQQMCYWLLGKNDFHLELPEADTNERISDETIFKNLGRSQADWSIRSASPSKPIVKKSLSPNKLIHPDKVLTAPRMPKAEGGYTHLEQ